MIYIIDMNAFYFKHYYVDKENFLKNIFNKLYDFCEKIPISKINIVYDGLNGAEWRRNIFSEYKTKRKEKDEEIIEGSRLVKEMVEFFPLRIFQVYGFEADEVIYLLSKIFLKKHKVSVLSVDNDLQQLDTDLLDPVTLKSIKKNDINIVEYKSMVGDPSDSIPGIKGFGKKSYDKWKEGKITLTEEKLKQKELFESIIDFKKIPKEYKVRILNEIKKTFKKPIYLDHSNLEYFLYEQDLDELNYKVNALRAIYEKSTVKIKYEYMNPKE